MIILVWDTETTGLTFHPAAPLSLQPSIIEFGASKFDSRILAIEDFSILINPKAPVSEEITKITGLKDEDLKDAPTFVEALPAIRLAFEDVNLMVAHNLPFDKNMLRNDLAKAWVTDFIWPRHELCTSSLFAEEWGRGVRMKELYEATIGKPLAQTHRALGDAQALADVVIKRRLWELFE